jgi:hypothetical protein
MLENGDLYPTSSFSLKKILTSLLEQIPSPLLSAFEGPGKLVVYSEPTLNISEAYEDHTFKSTKFPGSVEFIGKLPMKFCFSD